MEESELRAWLRLVGTPGVARSAARRLLGAFGSPEAVLDASTAARSKHVERPVAEALAGLSPEHDRRVEATLAWLAGGSDRAVVPLGDARYPAALLETADPPLVLHARGRIELASTPSLAIVGSRHATPQGLDNARAFAGHLAGEGFTIVSGLALGIDGAAHEGALDAGGATIAVVATGLDLVYPLRHRELAARIAGDGLLLSEFSIGTPGLAAHFPIRNRIIAGLARGTLVVEAAVQSGSLITARLAAEAGREVFAIPGSIHSPQSRGCHALIRQGAKLVDSARDILEELGAAVAPRPVRERTTTREDPLLEALGHDPIGLDALVARTGRSAADLSARLLDLELEGRVARLPGQQFQRRNRA